MFMGVCVVLALWSMEKFCLLKKTFGRVVRYLDNIFFVVEFFKYIDNVTPGIYEFLLPFKNIV